MMSIQMRAIMVTGNSNQIATTRHEQNPWRASVKTKNVGTNSLQIK